MGDQWAKALALRGNPLADRHSKPTFFGKGLCHGQTPFQPATQQELPNTFTHLKAVWQVIGKLGDNGIKKWCAPFKTMGHEHPVKLDQQIVWQPVCTIDRLSDGKAGSFAVAFPTFGRSNTVTPTVKNFRLQNVNLIKRSLRSHHTATQQ